MVFFEPVHLISVASPCRPVQPDVKSTGLSWHVVQGQMSQRVSSGLTCFVRLVSDKVLRRLIKVSARFPTGSGHNSRMYGQCVFLSLVGPSSCTTTNFLVNRLKTLPKMSVIRVQLRMITLYGILKSGVAKSTKRMGV
jgi:hypothetical protein